MDLLKRGATGVCKSVLQCFSATWSESRVIDSGIKGQAGVIYVAILSCLKEEGARFALIRATKNTANGRKKAISREEFIAM